MICLEAWHDLGADRQLGFSERGSIPFRAITGWARWHDLDREATVILICVIRRQDSIRVEREASKAKLKGSK